MFGRVALEDAPGELIRIADVLTILFPWGSLLRAVATAEPGALLKLAAIGKAGARVRFLFGYDPEKDAREIEEGLPALGTSSILRWLEAEYAKAGFQIRAQYAARDEVATVQSTWAKKIAFSGTRRRFIGLTGEVGQP